MTKITTIHIRSKDHGGINIVIYRGDSYKVYRWTDHRVNTLLNPAMTPPAGWHYSVHNFGSYSLLSLRRKS